MDSYSTGKPATVADVAMACANYLNRNGYAMIERSRLEKLEAIERNHLQAPERGEVLALAREVSHWHWHGAPLEGSKYDDIDDLFEDLDDAIRAAAR